MKMNEIGEKLRYEVEIDIEVTGIMTQDPDGKKRNLVTDDNVLYLEGEYNLIYDM